MKKKKQARKGPPYDLFGEIPVTDSDVDAWCWAVAGLGPDSWRRAYYIAHWNVVQKIQDAKASGMFDEIING